MPTTRTQAIAGARALLAEWEMDLLTERPPPAPDLLGGQIREALSRYHPTATSGEGRTVKTPLPQEARA
jgi:hypothetical protein